MERTQPPRDNLASHREQLRKCHYDNIAQLKLDIAGYDEQIQKNNNIRLLKGDYRVPEHRRATVRLVWRRHIAVERLQLLQEGWHKIALVLREESRKLSTLPRERKYFPKHMSAC
jgi:hypothetical protein